MKILPVSDLHFEFHRDYGRFLTESVLSKDIDLLIVAGDLCSSSILKESIKLLADNFPKVVYVLGNHEYYNSTLEKVHSIVEEASVKYNNFHWLNNNKITINNITFAGTTLWFKKPPKNISRDMLNDFKLIKHFGTWVYEENAKAINFLSQEVNVNDIVLTHMLPTYYSINEIYKGSPLNHFFLCDVEDIIKEKQPKYWFHGHTHCSCNYNINNCNIICNPFGYLRMEENPKFNPNLILEI